MKWLVSLPSALTSLLAIASPAPASQPARSASPSTVPTRIVFSSGETATVTAYRQSSYATTLASAATLRGKLRDKHQATKGKERSAVLQEARASLTHLLLSDILPAWHGTAWEFEGVSQVPGQGAIACGYFVTTTLRDAGLKLPRVKLAQQPSQTIIRTLCTPGTIKVFDERPIKEVVEYLEANGPGIYIVGLDCHTGFVVHDGESKAFIHSSYYKTPRAVVSEPVEGFNPLAHSKYRMMGKLFGDELVRKWMDGEAVEMKSR